MINGRSFRHSQAREEKIMWSIEAELDRETGQQAGADGTFQVIGLEDAVVQALIDNLIERGLDLTVCRLFIIDGAKALSKVIRRTFGANPPIQRCQIHKARNVIERLPMPLHASARRALRQAWELDDAAKAERLLRKLARPLDQEAPCG